VLGGRRTRPRGPSEIPEDAQVIFGRHVVEEAVHGRGVRVLQLWVLSSERRKHESLLKVAVRAGARVRGVNRGELDRLCGSGSHQGMVAAVREKPGLAFGAYLAGLSEKVKARTLLVALDQIQDPQNMGAIIRSAACLGASAVLSTERRASPLTQTVLRSSAGAAQTLPFFRIGNLAQTLRILKEQGFWIYGGDAAGKPAWDMRLNAPMVLVIGSEGQGIRPLVRASCDELVAIPQGSAGVSSLNASCAASVLLYEIRRQWKRPG